MNYLMKLNPDFGIGRRWDDDVLRSLAGLEPVLGAEQDGRPLARLFVFLRLLRELEVDVLSGGGGLAAAVVASVVLVSDAAFKKWE